MDLRDKITKDEKSMIEYYIDTYALEGAPRTATIDHLLREWAVEKESLFHLLGDNLIVSKEIEFEEDIEILLDAMYYNVTCAEGKGHAFIANYKFWLYDNFNPASEEHFFLGRLISGEVLTENQYNGKTFEIDAPDGKKIKIANGCRPLRTLAKIARAFNLNGFEEFRIAHSMVLNQRKLKGKLCLSIHPLDYITMSENDSNWTSCMNWTKRGCYRQGTVEMMNSPMIVVAYLASEDDMHVTKNLYWNNKKWRELYIVDRDIIGNIKAYPYRNDNITKICLSWLKELAEAANWTTYTKEIIQYDHDAVVTVPELDNKEYYVSTSTYMMYNDFSDNQLAYFNVNYDKKWIDLEYSGPNECLACGKLAFSQEAEDMLVCEECEGGQICDYCGERYPSGEGFVEVDGRYLCPDCAESACFIDDIDGSLHFYDDQVSLYISPDNGKTLIDTYLSVAESDLNMWDLKPFFRSLYQVRHYSPYHYSHWLSYITPEAVTKDGLELLIRNYDTRIKSVEEYMDRITSTEWIEKVDTNEEEDEYYTIYNWGKDE